MLCGLAVGLLATVAPAQSLRDRLTEGASKVGGVVKKTAQHVDQTVDSTINLAKNDPSPDITRAKLDTMAADTLLRLFAENPAAEVLYGQSAGYAVFDTRRATLIGVVAGFGKGVAVSNGTGQRTYMNMGTGGVGFAFGIGGFESQVVILFETDEIFDRFVHDGFDATAQAGSRMGDDEAHETLRFVDGRSFFALDRRGWRVNASAAGTKYWAAPDLNAPDPASLSPEGQVSEGNP
ncbi:MAG: hypothetical protein DI533_18295 [Cereibacter sphaeroides]|uniref:Ysc84 actin-binding domain-containing protein n=1 Tax=Cereibacter sphaeroides TaxID=1063 RepID=A0A2W5S3L7_CERSP|nr:MAG: hypothetical protein DI533_18295 [Cereibacter sphaeroides]